MRSRKKLLTMAFALLLVLAACSEPVTETFQEIGSSLDGGGDSGEGTTNTMAGAGAEPEKGPDDRGEPATTDTPDELGSNGVVPVALPINLGREIIFTADLVVAVSDVGSSGQEATGEIQSLGGFLFGQQTSGGAEPRSVLTFKIVPERFQEALDRLGSIGEVRQQSVNASDVTERIVDLESRIDTATASVERLRALLGEATDIKAIVELESELLARETELETLRGSLRTLQDQVALATIVLTLTEAASHPAFALTVTSYGAHDTGLSCPGDSGLHVDTGTEATVCYEIVNTGDTWLANFEMRDPVLDLEMVDLVPVFGDPNQPIEPGQSLILAAEVIPERDLRTQTTFTATAVDENGNGLSERPVSQTDTFFIETVDQAGIASFSDGLAASWDLLVSLGQMLVLVLGALLPFAWVPLAVWLVWRYRRKPTVEG